MGKLVISNQTVLLREDENKSTYSSLEFSMLAGVIVMDLSTYDIPNWKFLSLKGINCRCNINPLK